MRYDAIIVGAGLSGLTSALLLARTGRKVLIVEQHSFPAPVVSGFQRGEIYFDSGFHYAGGGGEGGPLRLMLRHLGIEDKLQMFPYARDGFDCLRISSSGEEFVLPTGFNDIKNYLGGKFPQARAEIELYLDEIASIWRNFPYLDLDTELVDFGMESVHGCSLQKRLEIFSPWPELQGLLSMHSLLYGVPPDQTPLSLNAQVAGSYYHSVHGICGGGRKLVQILLTLLKEVGVELQCNADVIEIFSADGTVAGVRLQTGKELFAAEVVATINPSLLPDMLPPSAMRPAYLKRLSGLYQTNSAYIVFARSYQSLEFLRGRNMFIQSHPGVFTSGLDQALDERPFYLTGTEQGDDNMIKGLIGIVPASYSEVDSLDISGKQRTPQYRQWKKDLGIQLLKMISDKCPQMPRLELVDLATPLTLRDYSRAPEGAIYGVGRVLGQYNPAPSTRLPGLFLAGQGVAGPGLLGTLVSSYLACGSILGHESLRGELRACR